MERDFFCSENVHVSLTRFTVFGKIYAMREITSVNISTVSPNRLPPTILEIIGGLILALGGDAIVFGLSLMGLAFWIWTRQKSEYIVHLSSSFGKVQALKSSDHCFVITVVQALNHCIVARG